MYFAISFLVELREDLDFRHLAKLTCSQLKVLLKKGRYFSFLISFSYCHIFGCTCTTTKSRQALDAIRTHY